MTSLPALREAVALIRRDIPEDQPGVYDDRRPVELAALRLALALPALLDEVEAAADLRHERDDLIVRLRVAVHERDAERIENAHLREAFGTMEKAYNVEHRRHSDLLGLLSEFYPAEADIRECLTRSRADLAAARAILDTARFPSSEANGRLLVNLDAAAWLAWQEREKR